MAKNTNHSNVLIKSLGVVLADTYVLAVKTHGCHWNVEGMHFSELHALFDGQYTGLFAAADDLAERLRALGAFAPTGMAQLLAQSTVKESGKPLDARAMLADLVKSHEAVVVSIEAARTAAGAAGDAVTDDLLIQRRTAHDKTLWMLRAHLA